jgi:AraC-like DNA-binding protein
MGFWDRSLRICKYLCDYGQQSVRQLAQQTGLSKSSVHRLRQAMARRSILPEAGLWETEIGRQWLTRLVVATLYTFGLKRGVGVDTLSEFFVRLRLRPTWAVHQRPCAG